jgi:hypothetical protein
VRVLLPVVRLEHIELLLEKQSALAGGGLALGVAIRFAHQRATVVP